MVDLDFVQRVESARKGTNPTIVCKVPSGWVALCDMQYLRGYCILLADPLVESINVLSTQDRARFMDDMVLVGDALLAVTGAYRINYGMFSNTDPYLHAHIIPRYMDEPEALRRSQPWAYPGEQMNANLFDAQRDRALMHDLAQAIQKRLG